MLELLSLQPLPQPPFLACTGVAVDSRSVKVKIPVVVDGDVIEWIFRSVTGQIAKWEMPSLLLLPRNRSGSGCSSNRKTNFWSVSLSRSKIWRFSAGVCQRLRIPEIDFFKLLPLQLLNTGHGAIIPPLTKLVFIFVWLAWCLAMSKLYQSLFRELSNPFSLYLFSLLNLHSNLETFSVR